jgi:ribonuclease PH
MRSFGRSNDALRNITFDLDYTRYAEGSVLCSFGHTKVLCNASVEDSVPSFLFGKKKGWVTAEYSLLPRATHTRTRREASQGKQGGRTLEIQRLIGRSLRGVVDLKKLGERTVHVDCDVLQADGGTRTASITGGYVALALAFNKMMKQGILHEDPLVDRIAAVSAGIVGGTPMLDLDYPEDSNAEVDLNLVMTGTGNIVEIQGTGEERAYSLAELNKMIELASAGISTIFELQQQALER